MRVSMRTSSLVLLKCIKTKIKKKDTGKCAYAYSRAKNT